MASSIKCSQCNTWNIDRDYCEVCNHLLSPKIIREIEVEHKRLEQLNKPKDKIDLWIEKGKNSNNIFVKAIFYFLYSIWVVFFAIVSFLFSFIVLGPG